MIAANMGIVVIVAIGILAAIFLASLAGLILVCKYRYCKPPDLISRQHAENNGDNTLVENMEGEQPVELVGFSIDNILNDDDWVNDATGLAPHCLAILRTCHELTEKLVGMTMRSPQQQLSSPEKLNELVTVAKGIGPRVDDVVKAMYPPLDPRLLEARCTSLVLSVHHLVLITKMACRLSGMLDWIDQSLADVEDHLRILREASANFDQNNCAASASQSESTSQAGAIQNSPPRNEEAKV